jgi:two-component system chemotaxis response regulator CheY
VGKAQPKVLSIGQCGVDGPAISKLLTERLGVQVDSADSIAEAQQKVQAADYSLVLINRQLAADGASGIELIDLLSPLSDAPLMLVSDYEEAQQEAQQKGAIPGFGKSDLYDEATLTRLRKALGQAG